MPWVPALALILGLVILPWAIRWLQEFQVPLPRCALRTYTGIPCPACGSTRSLIAWTNLDPLHALRLNPLFFFLCVGLAGWVASRALSRMSRPGTMPRLPLWLKNGARGLANGWVAFALILLNWIYLCLTLPK